MTSVGTLSKVKYKECLDIALVQRTIHIVEILFCNDVQRLCAETCTAGDAQKLLVPCTADSPLQRIVQRTFVHFTTNFETTLLFLFYHRLHQSP